MERTSAVQQICHGLGVTGADLARQRGGDRLALHSMQPSEGTGEIGRCVDAMRQAIGAADGDEETFTGVPRGRPRRH